MTNTMKYTTRFFFVLFLSVFCNNVLPNQNNFFTIPASSFELVDGLTGIKVTVSVSEFVIAKVEVTQAEFFDVMHYNPSFHKGDKKPVENVTWWEAITYCNLKSSKEGLKPCYNLSTGECDFSKDGYRLPTDAEWEIANTSDIKFDPETIQKYANIGIGDTKNVQILLQSLLEKGTNNVGSYPPNKFGLFDMVGNIWEWCYDYYNPVKNRPIPLRNPHGPPGGLERVIRGGSFITSVTKRNRNVRNSMNPDYKSRFTGFRICKSTHRLETKTDKQADSNWFATYNNVPEGFENNNGPLVSLITNADGGKISTIVQWKGKREKIKEKWSKILGTLPVKASEPNVKLIKTIEEVDYTGNLMYLQVEPDFWEKVFLMVPKTPLKKPLPAVIVPYYDVDVPVGKNMGGRKYYPMGVRSYAYLMVQQGYIAIAVRWFGESYGECYDEAAANLKLKYPACTGLGKWVWDVKKVVDFLYSLPEVDQEHIGIIGHSLGAKQALYAAAMDERITAVVASEGGIGLDFSNYDEYWYLGKFIRNIDKLTNHHELLALIAPRPFLLIGGDEYDTDKSWYFINAAKEVYVLFGEPQNIGYFNHHSGHSPTPVAVRLAVEWLIHFLSQ